MKRGVRMLNNGSLGGKKLLPALLTVVLLGGVLVTLHMMGWLDEITTEAVRAFVSSFGVWAPLIFILVYGGATVLVVPGSVLTLMSGALFGPLLGTVCAVMGASLGATISFMGARALRGGRPLSGESTWATRLVRYDERMAAQGFITVLFLRLVPLFPFSVLNYGLGLTRVRTRDYIAGTILGIIPGSFAYTYFGNALSMLKLLEVGIGVGLIIGLTFIGRYLAKRYG